MSDLVWVVRVIAVPLALILLFRRLYREDPGSRRKHRHVDLDDN